MSGGPIVPIEGEPWRGWTNGRRPTRPLRFLSHLTALRADPDRESDSAEPITGPARIRGNPLRAGRLRRRDERPDGDFSRSRVVFRGSGPFSLASSNPNRISAARVGFAALSPKSSRHATCRSVCRRCADSNESPRRCECRARSLRSLFLLCDEVHSNAEGSSWARHAGSGSGSLLHCSPSR